MLREPNVSPCGSQKADVYAFAIILYEIIGRRGPFGVTGLEPKGMLFWHHKWQIVGRCTQNKQLIEIRKEFGIPYYLLIVRLVKITMEKTNNKVKMEEKMSPSFEMVVRQAKCCIIHIIV